MKLRNLFVFVAIGCSVTTAFADEPATVDAAIEMDEAEPAPAPQCLMLAPSVDVPDAATKQPVAMAAAYADALAVKRNPHDVSRVAKFLEFDHGRVRVRSAERERLMAVAETWKAQGRSDLIAIEAFAITGERDGAQLALRRANKIRDYLVKYGVAADRVVAKSIVRPAGKVAKGSIDLAIGMPMQAACSDSVPSLAVTAAQ